MPSRSSYTGSPYETSCRRETIMQVRPVGLFVLLTLSLSVIPLAAKAPQVRPMPKIGMLMLGSPPASPDWKERSPFLQELRSLGWLEGRNVTIEYRWAQEGER